MRKHDGLLKALAVILITFMVCSIGQAAENDKKVNSNIKKEKGVKAFLFTWDGASPVEIQRLLKMGKMQYLDRLRKKGFEADYSITNFPSKTAACHAALFTGAWGRVNGIASNSVIKGRNKYSILEKYSGFDARNYLAETFWSRTAKEGLKTVVVHAAGSSPHWVYTKDSGNDNLIIFEGYNNNRSPWKVIKGSKLESDEGKWSALPFHEGKVRQFKMKLGETELYLAVFDPVKDDIQDYNKIIISTTRRGDSKNAVILNILDDPCFCNPIIVNYKKGPAGAFFLLMDLDSDGKEFSILGSAVYVETINGKAVPEEYIRATGGFIGNGASRLYLRGKLGKRFDRKSGFKAEKFYLETALLVIDTLSRKLEYAVKTYKPDVVVSYVPYPDEALHVFYGEARKETAVNYVNRQEARRIIDLVFIYCDRYLGEVMNNASPDSYIAVASDHGMSPYDKVVYPTEILKRAGLAAKKGRKVDLSKTKVIYGVENGAFLRVNTTDFKDGIVPPEKKDEVIQEAVVALSKVRDPDTGEAVFRGFYYPEQDGKRLGIGGPRGGDLYLDLIPGYYFATGFSKEPVKKVSPAGAHIFVSNRDEIRAICYLSGPGVPNSFIEYRQGGIRNNPDVKVPLTRIIDITPTLCRLLGISPPEKAEGRYLFDGVGKNK